MGTTGAQRLRRKSLSSERARKSIETIEAHIGVAVSSNLSYYQASETTPSERKVGNDNERSLEKTRKR